MELNVVSSNKPGVFTRKKYEVKRGWKARKQQKLNERAKAQRRIDRTKDEAAKTKIIQTQEFESGIDKTLAKRVPSDLALPHGNVTKKPRLQDRVGNYVKGDGKGDGKGDVYFKNSLKERQNGNQKRTKITNNSTPTPVKNLDQTPINMNATFEFIGGQYASNTTDKSPFLSVHNNEHKLMPAPDIGNSLSTQTDNAEITETAKKVDNVKSTEDQTFASTGLYHSVCHSLITRMGISNPTEIQRRVLKETLFFKDGQITVDLLIRSPTGSGKTLAYLLPISHCLLNRSKRISREDGTLAVIIVPTHELVEQVAEEARRLFEPWHWIVVGHMLGGESRHKEKARLRRGVNVLVATPGRLLDHMRNTQRFLYRYCEFLVLDEADRLLDLGFEAEVKEVVKNLDSQAQISNPGASKFRSNFLLSATLRKDVKQLAAFSLSEPVEITVTIENDLANDGPEKAFSMPLELRQHFCTVEQRHRLVTLSCFLRLRSLKDVVRGDVSAPQNSLPNCKVIVFFSTCDSVDFHYSMFNNVKLPSELRRPGTFATSSETLIPLNFFKIHGNHSQTDRAAALRGFRKSNRAVLLCTDVAARGLDLKGLTFAIQYDPPTGGEGEEFEYMHRAGRTARMGARGDALLFLLPSERAYVGKLEATGVHISEISSSAALAALYPLSDLSNAENISYASRLVTSAIQESVEQTMKDNEVLRQEAVAGFQAYCRAYATHAREVRHYFHVRNLHLGHVARAFGLNDKPAELSELMHEIKTAKTVNSEKEDLSTSANAQSKNKGHIARAIAEGDRQPYNLQTTELARRRREKGRGQEVQKELALEFSA